MKGFFWGCPTKASNKAPSGRESVEKTNSVADVQYVWEKWGRQVLKLPERYSRLWVRREGGALKKEG